MSNEGTKSSPKIFANIFIAFIGAGVLGVPFAFKEVSKLLNCYHWLIEIFIDLQYIQ